jgi:hypothetical protein
LASAWTSLPCWTSARPNGLNVVATAAAMNFYIFQGI